MLSQGVFCIDIGAKDVEVGSVRVDIDPGSNVHVVASATDLPFREGCFEAAILSEVVEHLPRGTESRALAEIRRILRRGGCLLLTTPNDGVILNLLDPAWLLGHRHYTKADVEGMLRSAGFSSIRVFRSGGVNEILTNIVYLFGAYLHLLPWEAVCRLLNTLNARAPDVAGFDNPRGSTIFAIAVV